MAIAGFCLGDQENEDLFPMGRGQSPKTLDIFDKNQSDNWYIVVPML